MLQTTNDQARLLDVSGLAQYCGVGRNKAFQVGKEAGAEVRLGRRLLFDRHAIDRYIDEKRETK